MEYYVSDSEEEEEQDDAIDFSTLSEKIYVVSKKGRRKSIITLQSELGSILSILTSGQMSKQGSIQTNTNTGLIMSSRRFMHIF